MTNDVSLRAVIPTDLSVFFTQQLDPEANHQAAFTAPDPTDRGAFDAHWARIGSEERVTIRTILLGEQVAGYVASYDLLGEPQVSYWLGREFWGRGIATRALAEFLTQVTERPLQARAARDHRASVRVLEKCGFVIQGFDRYFSHARGEEVEEVILTLTSNDSSTGTG
jgi:RimJ/RimL family protein N-acetyltransferase